MAADPGERASPSIDELTINTIRTLTLDAVEKAASGHPGTPMGMAPVGYILWSRFLRYDPDRPDWPNRDRFVLSVGHASLLLYSLLHLSGVREIDADGRHTGQPAVSLDDIKQFRQLDSKTPGHPEYRVTTGVEATTGPLGQGCGNSVGMALAERWLAAHFNRDGAILFDHDVYALCSDGDMMEGVASEAASLAGHLKLSNLCWIYDNNHITIEGGTPLAFSESVAERFRGYGWNVLHVADANDLDAVAQALDDVPPDQGCADPDRRRQRHRLGLAGRRHRQGAQRSDGRGSDPGDEARLRLARGFAVPRAARSRGSFPVQPRRSVEAASRGLGPDSDPLSQPSIPSSPRSSIVCSKAGCPTAGPATFRTSRRTPREWHRAMPAARC